MLERDGTVLGDGNPRFASPIGFHEERQRLAGLVELLRERKLGLARFLVGGRRVRFADDLTLNVPVLVLALDLEPGAHRDSMPVEQVGDIRVAAWSFARIDELAPA